MNIPLVLDKDGKKVFVGHDDPNNPPVQRRDANLRHCPKCNKDYGNDMWECPDCGYQFSDGKMECPVCHKFFDYLVGENGNGGVMGCESCWKPPTKQERKMNEATTKEVFD